MKYFWCCIFIFLQFTSISIAQISYSTQNKSAIKSFEKASYFLDLNKFSEATVELKQAISIDSNFTEAYLLLADVYRVSYDYVNAKVSYLNAYKVNPNIAPERYFYLAECELKTGDYENAIIHFNDYLTKANPPEARIIHTNKLLKDCSFAINAIKNPVPFKPVNLGEKINSIYDEYFCSLTIDENNVIFTRQINNNEDFFHSYKIDNEWLQAKNMGNTINTPSYNEGAQCISPDGKFLFFTGCNRPDGLGRCDIYVSQKEGDNWSKPVNLGHPINTKGWESQPSLSADGRTLYFVSDRKGGYGSYDIWKSTLNENNKWETPINLGPNINTAYEEQSPFIHPDNETLYFASNGWEGLGGKDLYISRLAENGNWKTPINLGYPINTYGDENGLTINANGTKAYFSSNNFNGFGGFDIYSFDLPTALKPNVVNYVRGKVFDHQTKKPLEALVEIIDLKTEEDLYATYTDIHNGTFLTTLPRNKLYSLNVSKEGYLFYSENFSIERYQPDEPVILEIPLQKIEIGNTVVLKNVFFDTNKFNLKNESTVELLKLIEFLQENKGLVIEIRGYTDNVGNAQSNLLLSQNRAKSVFNYLVDAGINSNRITHKGFGDANPVSENTTQKGRANNRRTEFVITSLQ
jgi:outer membrane protein OmpA-like peptidoglycan-associated protein